MPVPFPRHRDRGVEIIGQSCFRHAGGDGVDADFAGDERLVPAHIHDIDVLALFGKDIDLNVHSLRHTAASLFIASGTDVGTVAGLLGHSQPSTTLDIYTHAFDKNKKAASQIMQSNLEI